MLLYLMPGGRTTLYKLLCIVPSDFEVALMSKRRRERIGKRMIDKQQGHAATLYTRLEL